MEEPVLRGWCESPAQFVHDLAQLGSEIDALFLEEAQWLDGVGLFVKGLVDLRLSIPIVVTGSASFHLRDKMRETLAGRATRHVLLPFSLQEVAPAGETSGAILDITRRDAFVRQLSVGGYPEAWLSEHPSRVLGDLVQAFILRDASDLFSVDRIDAYQTLLQLAAGQVGNLINLSEWAALCGVSVNTVSRYLSIMEEAHVVRLLKPFAGGKRREVTRARKVYFLDNGLRNAVLGRPLSHPESAPDRGQLYENWALGELQKCLGWMQPLRYWRSVNGAEVDFVVSLAERLLGIEIKAGPLARKRLSKSSRSFIEAYQPSEFWVLADEAGFAETIGSTKVRWCSIHRLPDLLREFCG